MASSKFMNPSNSNSEKENPCEKLGLGSEIREVKLGGSFSNRGAAFHTLKYDFKPASVDTSKVATVDMGKSNQVTITVPHLDGASTAQTVFKGSRKPHMKECVLIIDPATGEITLEKLSHNIQVKKMRMEGKSSQSLPPPLPNPVPDVAVKKHLSSQSKLSMPHPRNSQRQLPNKSPNTVIPRISPTYQESLYISNQKMASTLSPMGGANTNSPRNHSNHVSPSMPIIGMDTPSMPIIGMDNSPPRRETDKDDTRPTGVLSDSSSDTSRSSDSESEPEKQASNSNVKQKLINNGNMPDILSLPHSLTEDLQLSESESE